MKFPITSYVVFVHNQTIELFNGIRSHFVAPDSPEDKAPGFETNSFDVS